MSNYPTHPDDDDAAIDAAMGRHPAGSRIGATNPWCGGIGHHTPGCATFLNPPEPADIQPPAGWIAFEPHWRRSPNRCAWYRAFASQRFPVGEGITVDTGGTQLITDTGDEFILRDIRVTYTADRPAAPLHAH